MHLCKLSCFNVHFCSRLQNCVLFLWHCTNFTIWSQPVLQENFWNSSKEGDCLTALTWGKDVIGKVCCTTTRNSHYRKFRLHVSTTQAFQNTPSVTATCVSCQSLWQLRGTIDNRPLNRQTSNTDVLKSQLQTHAHKNPHPLINTSYFLTLSLSSHTQKLYQQVQCHPGWGVCTAALCPLPGSVSVLACPPWSPVSLSAKPSGLYQPTHGGGGCLLTVQLAPWRWQTALVPSLLLLRLSNCIEGCWCSASPLCQVKKKPSVSLSLFLSLTPAPPPTHIGLEAGHGSNWLGAIRRVTARADTLTPPWFHRGERHGGLEREICPQRVISLGLFHSLSNGANWCFTLHLQAGIRFNTACTEC